MIFPEPDCTTAWERSEFRIEVAEFRIADHISLLLCTPPASTCASPLRPICALGLQSRKLAKGTDRQTYVLFFPCRICSAIICGRK